MRRFAAARYLLHAAVALGVVAIVLYSRHKLWEPLNVDEELTIRVAQFSFGGIYHMVSTQRGGGPFHFWLEHFTLGWWPGIPALRVPSLIFACLALPAVALIARELLEDDLAAAAVVLLTALSPVPLAYATFGRPHAMLYAWLMWATAAGLRAARTGSRVLWIVAGAAFGLTVFIHPTAPLYALVGGAVVLICAPRPPRVLVREVWPGVVALLVTLVPYYAKTLHVLTSRYGVGKASSSSGHPVFHDAILYLSAEHRSTLLSQISSDLNYFTALALVGIGVLAYTRRWRLLLFCVLTVAAPIVFFAVVPASGGSAVFFDRYVIPVIPAFLVLVVAGAMAIARQAGPLRVPILLLLVAALLHVELKTDSHRQGALGGLKLDKVTKTVAREANDAVLFGSTGTSAQNNESFNFGRPANLLDRYVSLQLPSLTLVDDDACVRVAPFMTGPQTPRHGLWLFFASFDNEWRPGAASLRRVPGVSIARPDPRYFVVRSTQALPPRALVQLGRRLRLAWRSGVPENARVNELLQADDQVLSDPHGCPSLGQLADPDIGPNWPPGKRSN